MTYLRLLDVVSVVESDQSILLACGRRCLRIPRADETLKMAVSMLAEGCARERLWEVAGGKRATALVAALDTEGWVERGQQPITKTSDPTIGYLGAFGPAPKAYAYRLRQSSVLLLGLGGVGSILLQHLVGAGVRRFTLIDHDTVNAGNFNRQYIYALSDVGRLKVEAARTYVTSLDATADVSIRRQMVSSAADLEPLASRAFDLVAIAIDRPLGIQATVAEWAESRGLVHVGAAVGVEVGYWGPIFGPAAASCFGCWESEREHALKATERKLAEATLEPSPFSFGTSNGFVATAMAHDVLKFLATGSKDHLGKYRAVDLARYAVTTHQVRQCVHRAADV